MTDDEGRGRGILTDADRRFLNSPEEYSRQAQHAREDAIQNRFKNSILDFTILFDHLDHEQRKKVFEGRMFAAKSFDDPDFEAGVRDAIALMLEGSGAVGLLKESAPSDMAAERLISEALERIAWRYGYDLQDVQINVTADRIPVRELEQRLTEGEELTIDELTRLALARRDAVDLTSLQDLLRTQLTDTEE
jgi:hypothetical protein